MNLNRWLPCASPVSLDVEGIFVSVAKPEQLLAMKVAAARYGKDDADVKLLIRMLGLTSVTQVLDVVETTYGEELARKILTPKT